MSDEDPRVVIAELDAAIAERDELLAIIHRDGGHYVGEHGITKAVADAHATWAAVVAERDAAIAERDRLRRELESLRDEMREWCHGLDTTACHRAVLYGPTIDRIDAILRGDNHE